MSIAVAIFFKFTYGPNLDLITEGDITVTADSLYRFTFK